MGKNNEWEKIRYDEISRGDHVRVTMVPPGRARRFIYEGLVVMERAGSYISIGGPLILVNDPSGILNITVERQRKKVKNYRDSPECVISEPEQFAVIRIGDRVFFKEGPPSSPWVLKYGAEPEDKLVSTWQDILSLFPGNPVDITNKVFK